jgi:hypothetical protein
MSQLSSREVLSSLLPGHVALEKGVLERSICEQYGKALLGSVLSDMSEDEVEAMKFSPIHDTSYVMDSVEAPSLISSLCGHLDSYMPDSVGTISLLRLRYQRKCDYAFPHTDSLSDYRLSIPLLGTGEITIYDPITSEVSGTQLFEPGDVMALNNNVQEFEKVPHSVISISDERLVLVYGREILKN